MIRRFENSKTIFKVFKFKIFRENAQKKNLANITGWPGWTLDNLNIYKKWI